MKSIIAVVFTLLLGACSSSFTEVKQVDDKAYLQLTGAIDDGTLLINDQSIDLGVAEKFEIDGNEVAKFEIASGTHLITVSRNGQVIVKRKIYVTNGNVAEVIVP